MSNLRPRVVVTFIALLTVAETVLSHRADADDGPPRFHLLVGGPPAMTIRRALQGAMQRLSTPACERVLDDFTDQTGRRLAVSVAVQGQSPAALLSALYFVNGDDTTLGTNETVALFTAPGSHVVHVCGKRFVRFARNTTAGEFLLIHELLHVLGLGENPPTSAQITDVVMNRCG